MLSRLPCWQQIQLGTVGTPDPEKNLHKISCNTKTCRVDMSIHICILHSMLPVNKNRSAPVKYNWKCRLNHRQLREMPESALHFKKMSKYSECKRSRIAWKQDITNPENTQEVMDICFYTFCLICWISSWLFNLEFVIWHFFPLILDRQVQWSVNYYSLGKSVYLCLF